MGVGQQGAHHSVQVMDARTKNGMPEAVHRRYVRDHGLVKADEQAQRIHVVGELQMAVLGSNETKLAVRL